MLSSCFRTRVSTTSEPPPTPMTDPAPVPAEPIIVDITKNDATDKVADWMLSHTTDPVERNNIEVLRAINNFIFKQ